MEEDPTPDAFAPLLRSEALMGPLLLTGRLFTTGIFTMYAANQLRDIRQMASPAVPVWLLVPALLIQLAGIAMVALGYRTRFAARMMAAFCIVSTLTTLQIHMNPIYGTLFMRRWMKDLAVAAGFLFMSAYGPGPLSLDWRLGREPLRPASTGSARVGESLAMAWVLLGGRVLSTLIFLYAGSNKVLRNASMRAMMARINPHVPPDLINLAIVVQLIAPVLVLLGYKTRYAALALAGFCITATVLFHGEISKSNELQDFLVDFAIAGGFGFMFAHGPGLLSLDALFLKDGVAGRAR